MRINWGDAVAKGFKFGIHPKRWLPFFLVDLVFGGIFAYLIITNMATLAATAALAMASEVPAGSAGMFAWFLVLMAAWGLVKLWVVGAVLRQSFKEKEFCQSFRFSLKRYLPLLAASLMIGIVSVLASMVPYVGVALWIIPALVFLFVQPSVINGKGAFDAIRQSWKIFRKHYVKVIAMWLILAALSAVMFFVSTLPPAAVITNALLPFAQAGMSETAMAAGILMMAMNPANLIISIILTLAGFAITKTILFKITVEYYRQLTKRFRL